MPIIKYIAVHGSPLKLLEYVTNENKTSNMLTSSIKCSADPHIAYKEMEQSFEHFSGQRFWKKSLFMKIDCQVKCNKINKKIYKALRGEYESQGVYEDDY